MTATFLRDSRDTEARDEPWPEREPYLLREPEPEPSTRRARIAHALLIAFTLGYLYGVMS